MQGLMYSLGYDPIFPSSFSYRDYYFYSELEINGITYHFLRKDKDFLIRNDDEFHMFTSVTDFKYFLNENVIPLPSIVKDHRNKMVDPSLFYEIFFIGQDNRSPSGLISKGQFNKTDFVNMVLSIAGINNVEINRLSIDESKKALAKLKQKFKDANKKIKIIKQNPQLAEGVSKSYNDEKMHLLDKNIEKINKNISEIKKSRTRESNQKFQLEQLISELNSLNRKLQSGVVTCGDCGSENITYVSKGLTFDISNSNVRSQILKSIRENIDQKSERIQDLEEEIISEQNLLNLEMENTPSNHMDYYLYRSLIKEGRDYDEEAFLLKNEKKT